MRTRRSTFCLLLCSLAAGSLSAQQATPLRGGFWFGGGGGYGRMNLPNCVSCEVAGVPVGSIRLGGKLSDRMLLGFEMNLAANGAASGLPSLVAATATAYFYPRPQTGLHFKLGVGAAARGAYSNVDGVVGLGMVVGTGYDFRIARNISIVPSLAWLAMPGSYSANVFQAGLGITFH